jgi:DNA-binding transcriptional regulator YiaG
MRPAEIKALREGLGLTQDQAGQVFGSEAKSGRSRGTWSSWESGQRSPSGPALTLLLLLRDVPAAAEWVRNRAR